MKVPAVAIVLLVLPALVLGAIVRGGKDTAKVCGNVLVKGVVKQNVPDPDDCSQYYLCTKWFRTKKTCKDGEHFSVIEDKCIDACLAGCDTTLVCTTTPAATTEVVTEEMQTEALEEDTTDLVAGADIVKGQSEDAKEEPASADAGSVAGQVVSKVDSVDTSINVVDSVRPAAEDETSKSPVTGDAGNVAQEGSGAEIVEDDVVFDEAAPGVPLDEENPKPDEEPVAAANENAAETDKATEVADTDVTTQFWQGLIKRYQSPAGAGGFDGTIPTNY